jgi:hypothetical protein
LHLQKDQRPRNCRDHSEIVQPRRRLGGADQKGLVGSAGEAG